MERWNCFLLPFTIESTGLALVWPQRILSITGAAARIKQIVARHAVFYSLPLKLLKIFIKILSLLGVNKAMVFCSEIRPLNRSIILLQFFFFGVFFCGEYILESAYFALELS
jgi:hypothetical protein